MPRSILNIPKSYETYDDCEGRQLVISKVILNDRLGREVQGTIQSDPYSCTIKAWSEIWRDKVPRIQFDKMKIG